MGRPKQLLPWKGETLLRPACQTALATACRPIIVVLGHEAKRCQDEMAGLPVATVINDRWEQGMGGSVSRGISELERLSEQAAAALVMLADQPAVTAEFLNSIERAWQGERGR